ncbi:MAG: HpcH/HpaI aldolase family protein [Nitrososphaeria archaeon]
MEFFTGGLRDILRKNQLSIGMWITIPCTEVPEALSRLGFDWFVFDTEHAPTSLETIQRLLPSLNGSNTMPVIRVAWNDIVMIKRALDLGVEGIIVPWVNTKEDAIKAVKACKYPPQGVRGVGPRRAAAYGLDPSYYKRANDNIALIVQIETQEAIDNVDEILAVDGVDSFFIGPQDLSFSLGTPHEYESPKFMSAIDRVLEAGKKLGKPGGIYTSGAQDAIKYMKKGFKFIALSSDIKLLVNSVKKELEATKVFKEK